jgi:hypothetical protein
VRACRCVALLFSLLDAARSRSKSCSINKAPTTGTSQFRSGTHVEEIQCTLRPHPTKALLEKRMSQGVACTFCRCRRVEDDTNRNCVDIFNKHTGTSCNILAHWWPCWCSVTQWTGEGSSGASRKASWCRFGAVRPCLSSICYVFECDAAIRVDKIAVGRIERASDFNRATYYIPFSSIPCHIW